MALGQKIKVSTELDFSNDLEIFLFLNFLMQKY